MFFRSGTKRRWLACFLIVLLIQAAAPSGTAFAQTSSAPSVRDARTNGLRRDVSPIPATNPPGPRLRLKAPEASAWRGRVSLGVDAASAVTLLPVSWTVNGRPVATAQKAPYSFELDTTALPDGAYEIGLALPDYPPDPESARLVEVDNTPPAITATETEGSLWLGDPLFLRVVFEERGSGIDNAHVRLGNQLLPLAPQADGSWGVTIEGLQERVQYRIEATDRAGNRMAWPEESLARTPCTGAAHPYRGRRSGQG